MSKSIEFIEQGLKVADKQDDIEFLVELLFQLTNDEVVQ